VLNGRYHATVGDVQAVIRPALRHRIAGNYAAQAAGVNSEKLIEMLLESIPRTRNTNAPRLNHRSARLI